MMMNSYICGVIASLLLASPQQLTFEVATVKSVAGTLPDGRVRIGAAPIGNPSVTTPGRVHYDRVSLQSILLVAFSLKEMQLVRPDWMASGFYEIDARMPVGATTDQMKTMLQNLLVERFKMTIHRETRQTDTYRLVVGKGGSKLKEVQAPESNAVLPPPAPVQRDAEGWIIAPRRPGVTTDDRSDRSRWTFQQSPITALVTALENRIQKPVTDATSLNGYYNFMLTFSGERLPPPTIAGLPIRTPPGVVQSSELPPIIFTALEDLGLKLEQVKGSIDVLVIDQADKTPISN